MKIKNVLMIASECFPYARTGGLSDVIPSLASAINNLNPAEIDTKFNTSIAIPFYGLIRKAFPNISFKDEGISLTIPIYEENLEGHLFSINIDEKTKLYLVENNNLFDRDTIYGDKFGEFKDNPKRFYFLSAFFVKLIELGKLKADIIHAHDWHAGLVPAIIKTSKVQSPQLKKIKTVITVHNAGYQGFYRDDIITIGGFDKTLFPKEHFNEIHSSLPIEQGFSFLKTGIYFADKINTVSPTYAKELQLPQFGFGLEKIFTGRKKRFCGDFEWR